MSRLGAPGIGTDVTQRTADRIEAHLARLTAGHDPLGHLFAIERLARATRAELQTAQRHPDQAGDHR